MEDTGLYAGLFPDSISTHIHLLDQAVDAYNSLSFRTTFEELKQRADGAAEGPQDPVTRTEKVDLVSRAEKVVQEARRINADAEREEDFQTFWYTTYLPLIQNDRRLSFL